MTKKLTKADIVGMQTIIRNSPDMTMLQVPTWLIRGYLIHDRQKLLTEIAEQLPEKQPKVIKRKGYYPPYQPQVEQHRRTGFNEALEEVHAILRELGKEQS